MVGDGARPVSTTGYDVIYLVMYDVIYIGLYRRRTMFSDFQRTS